MESKVLKNNELKWTIQELASHICNKNKYLDDEVMDVYAAVSHWLQSPSLKVPLLTQKLMDECHSFIVKNFDLSKKACFPKNNITLQKKPAQFLLDFLFENITYPPPSLHDFTFIDLFAGIGGFRIAFQEAGGKCVFSSEWDKFAKQTYEANFGEIPFGDIRKINAGDIPDHDILCAGFPCQPFSLAGVSKKQSLGSVDISSQAYESRCKSHKTHIIFRPFFVP